MDSPKLLKTLGIVCLALYVWHCMFGIVCLALAVAHLTYTIVYQWKNSNAAFMPWLSCILAIVAVFLFIWPTAKKQ
jgi:uncharacterized membrane protein YdjX (TVP38/TMEM64 family)